MAMMKMTGKMPRTVAAPNCVEDRGKAEDGARAADLQRRAAGDVEHAQRDDEGVNLPALGDEAVEEAAGAADQQAGEHGEKDGDGGRGKPGS